MTKLFFDCCRCIEVFPEIRFVWNVIVDFKTGSAPRERDDLQSTPSPGLNEIEDRGRRGGQGCSDLNHPGAARFVGRKRPITSRHTELFVSRSHLPLNLDAKGTARRQYSSRIGMKTGLVEFVFRETSVRLNWPLSPVQCQNLKTAFSRPRTKIALWDSRWFRHNHFQTSRRTA